MAQDYFDRLRGVRNEYDAARAALAILVRNWDSTSSVLAGSIAIRDAKRALDNLDLTYFIRLHAEMESILRDDTRSNGGVIPPKPDFWLLVSRALRARRKQRRTIDFNSSLFPALKRIHEHRNGFAHGDAPRSPITFDEALRVFNTFLFRLTLP